MDQELEIKLQRLRDVGFVIGEENPILRRADAVIALQRAGNTYYSKISVEGSLYVVFWKNPDDRCSYASWQVADGIVNGLLSRLSSQQSSRQRLETEADAAPTTPEVTSQKMSAKKKPGTAKKNP